MSKRRQLHPYRAFAADEDWSFLVFARSAREAKPVAYQGLLSFSDEYWYTETRVRRIRGYPPELMQCADPNLLANGIAHAVLDGVPECTSCGAWPIVGEHAGCRGPVW